MGTLDLTECFLDVRRERNIDRVIDTCSGNLTRAIVFLNDGNKKKGLLMSKTTHWRWVACLKQSLPTSGGF